jgi:hypothetical protein
MHSDACDRVQPELIELKLIKTIEGISKLKDGTSGPGIKVMVHALPEKPSYVKDDGEFRLAILGPEAASSPGNPSTEARRYLDETTAADRPRVYRNAVVLAVPSKDGLAVARNRIKDYLAWEAVQSQLKEQKVEDPIRLETVISSVDTAKKAVPKTVQEAYNIIVTVNAANEIQAFKLNIDTSKPLFEQIRNDKNSRIQETAIDFEALLPEGPYDLWRSGETSRLVRDLAGAFAQFPHLPKMLNRQAILETIIEGCRAGQFVLRLPRPDHSFRSLWRQNPSDEDLKNSALEAVLPAHAELSQIDQQLLAPKALPGLRQGDELTVATLKGYFSGDRTVTVPREGYAEEIAIPKANPEVVEQAVGDAVKAGTVWLTSGPASLLAEDIPPGLLTDDATLHDPPPPVSVTAIQPENLPKAWVEGKTTARAIADALSEQTQKILPWRTVRDAIDAAVHARIIERAEDSGPWPCDIGGASQATFVLPTKRPVITPPPDKPQPSGVRLATAYLKTNEIQDLADRIGEIGTAAVGHDLKIQVRLELGGKAVVPKNVLSTINGILEKVSEDLKFET